MALLTLHCAGSPDDRVSSIYELKADPTDENRQRVRAMLADPDRDVRATALNAMFAFGVPDEQQLALAALSDTDGFVRSTAAKLLGDRANPRHAEPLVARLLEDTDPWVRQRSAEALQRIGGDVAVDGLTRGLDDPMSNVRLASVGGLRELAPPSAVPSLARLLLEDTEWEIRAQAARALGVTGDPEILPVLEAALEDPNEFVRTAAANALRVHAKVPAADPDPPAEPPGDPPGL